MDPQHALKLWGAGSNCIDVATGRCTYEGHGKPGLGLLRGPRPQGHRGRHRSRPAAERGERLQGRARQVEGQEEGRARAGATGRRPGAAVESL